MTIPEWLDAGKPIDCIVQGDCLEGLKLMEDKSVDAVITDPPFGIGFKYNMHIDNSDGYGEWLWSIIEMSEAKCKPGSPLFVWQAMLNVRQFTDWFPREWRIFAACKNFVQMRKIAMQYAFEPVVVWWTEGIKYSAGTANRDWHIGNTANTMNRKNGDAMGHPCARPLNQIEHIIYQWVRPNGIVLDPFLGSGTSAVAAIRTGRHYLGFELDPTYYAMAQKRIGYELQQTRLELL